MKRKIIFVTVAFLLVLQVQAVFAADYDLDFCKALNKNDLRGIENLLSKRAREMDLVECMYTTLVSPKDYNKNIGDWNTNNFNKANCLDVLKLLVRYGTDVNKQYWIGSSSLGMPLENAIEHDHSFPVIQFLLDSGANPNGRQNYTSPLESAYYKNNSAVVNILLERGAECERLLPLVSSKGDNQMVKLLITRGVQIRSEQGAEALKEAARNGKIDTVKLLVESGVNVNARDSKGVTALSTAYDKGEMEIYNYLKANGAIDFEPKQATAQPAAPAQSSSTTNVYVQPAPAQSDPSQTRTAPATPTLQTGRYACSGTNVTMELLPTTRFVTLYSGNTTVGNGQYNINGNNITITIVQASGVASFMQGKTYAYTITSDTSFSGSGENWYKR